MRFFNPEIQRYFWLNFSWFRVLVPLAIMVIALLIPYYLTEGLNSAETADTRKLFTVIYMWFFCGIALYSGNVQAGNTFAEEVRVKTWDFQRTSALKPLHLVIGKVVGSTCYTWYAGLLVLATAWYLAPPNWVGLPYFMMGLICAGVVGQLTAFAYSISSDDSASFPGILVSIIVVGLFSTFLEVGTIATLKWYGYTIETPLFYCMTTALFGFWVFRGAVGMMRKRMSYRNLPFDFLFFVLTIGFYCVGFLSPEKALPIKAVVFYFAVLPCLFWGFMLEAGNLNGYKRFLHALYHREYRRILEHLPRWTIPLLLSVAAFGIYLIYMPLAETSRDIELTVLLASILCFMLRDGIILHLFLLRGDERFGSFKVLVFFLFAYMMLPGLVLSAFEGGLSPQNYLIPSANSKGVAPSVWDALHWFWPQTGDDAFAVLFPPALETLVAGYFLTRKIQSIRKDSVEEKSPAGCGVRAGEGS